MKLSHEVLSESKSARNSIVERTDSQAYDALSKAKALIMATWQGTGYATTEQVAEYYEVNAEAIKWHLRQNEQEFANELKKLTGQELRDARELYSLASKTSQALLFTARGMLRVGLILTQSATILC